MSKLDDLKNQLEESKKISKGLAIAHLPSGLRILEYFSDSSSRDTGV